MVKTKALTEAEKRRRMREYNDMRERTQQKIAERREECREKVTKKHRRRSKALLIFMLLIMTIGIITTLCFTVFFKIETINVDGKTRYTKEEIIARTGVITGDNLFSVDKSRVSKTLTELLPYIGTAKVSGDLPSGLVITVTEAQPQYIFESPAGYLVTDQYFKVLEIKQNIQKNNKLCVIKGVRLNSFTAGKELDFETSQAQVSSAVESGAESAAESQPVNTRTQLDDIKELIAAIDRYRLSGVTEINITDNVNISFVYKGKILCKAGTLSEIDYKVKFAKKVLTEKLAKSDIGTLDLSCAQDDESIYFKRQSLKDARKDVQKTSEVSRQTSENSSQSEDESQQSTEESYEEDVPEE